MCGQLRKELCVFYGVTFEKRRPYRDVLHRWGGRLTNDLQTRTHTGFRGRRRFYSRPVLPSEMGQDGGRTTVQQRGQNHHSRTRVSRSIRMSRATATNVPSDCRDQR